MLLIGEGQGGRQECNLSLQIVGGTKEVSGTSRAIATFARFVQLPTSHDRHRADPAAIRS